MPLNGPAADDHEFCPRSWGPRHPGRVEVAGSLELASMGERAGVDRPHPAVLHQLAHGCLRLFVVDARKTSSGDLLSD
jgi:hypothetical protein